MKIEFNILCKTAQEQDIFNKEKQNCQYYEQDFQDSFVDGDNVHNIIGKYIEDYQPYMMDISTKKQYIDNGYVQNTIIFSYSFIGIESKPNTKLQNELTNYIQSVFKDRFNND